MEILRLRYAALRMTVPSNKRCPPEGVQRLKDLIQFSKSDHFDYSITRLSDYPIIRPFGKLKAGVATFPCD